MIRTLMGATAALALLASSGAFAATTPPATTPAPAASPAQTQPVQTQQAQPQSIGQPQIQAKTDAPAQVAKPQRVAMHHRYRDVVGNRETAALNDLEASGYFSVKDMHPDGKNISVEAKKSGSDFTRLTVQPNGAINPAA